MGLFEFIKKTNVPRNVLFVWDCDSTSDVNKKVNSDKVKKFCFEKNEQNKICKRGIENLFPEDFFPENLLKVTTCEEDGVRTVNKDLPSKNKNKFLEKIINETNKETFKNFKPLINEVNLILNNIGG